MVASTDAREYEDLKFHPAANIYPLLEDEEFDSFMDDVRTKGLLEPIKLYEGQVIDGRNRYRAYVITKTPPNFVDVTAQVNEVGGPAEYVLSLGDKRRHMEKSQRAMCAARLLDYETAEAKKRQQESGRAVASRPRGESGHFQGGGDNQKSDGPGQALKVAGKKLGVSHDTVHKAAKILKEGTAEVVKAVDTGKVSVGAAVKIAALPKEEQPAAIKEAVEKPARNAGKSRLAESQWDEARRYLDKVRSICEQGAAHAMVGGSQQFKNVLDGIKRLGVCIDSLERKAKN